MGHTPGPWYNDGYRIYAPTSAADKRCGRMIVEYKHVDDFNYDDGYLIEAAPDMLEALKNLENDDGSIPAHAWEMVKAAIAKAEGRS